MELCEPKSLAGSSRKRRVGASDLLRPGIYENPAIRLAKVEARRQLLSMPTRGVKNHVAPGGSKGGACTVCMFGLTKKQSAISESYEYVADHFSEWFPDLPFHQGDDRRPGRLGTVLAPLVEKALSEISRAGTRKEAVRIADSMQIIPVKGQRASQSKIAVDRFASVGYCSSKDAFFHGARAPRRCPAEKRDVSSSSTGRTDAGKRKRPSCAPARAAECQGRGPPRRLGLLERTARRATCREP